MSVSVGEGRGVCGGGGGATRGASNSSALLRCAPPCTTQGYSLAYGDGGSDFSGNDFFFLSGAPITNYPEFFFQWTFAATATTIVSGSMAGRECVRLCVRVLAVVAVAGGAGRGGPKGSGLRHDAPSPACVRACVQRYPCCKPTWQPI